MTGPKSLEPQPGFSTEDWRKRSEYLASSFRDFVDETQISGKLTPNSEEWRQAVDAILRASYLEGAGSCAIKYRHDNPAVLAGHFYDTVRAWLMEKYGSKTLPNPAQLKFDLDDTTHQGVIIFVKFNVPW